MKRTPRSKLTLLIATATKGEESCCKAHSHVGVSEIEYWMPLTKKTEITKSASAIPRKANTRIFDVAGCRDAVHPDVWSTAAAVQKKRDEETVTESLNEDAQANNEARKPANTRTCSV
ncbi:unnamed protein product [Prorocentrum cordatum]|uniref:Uncharacterized protein n=1 Tax=Prorocentrum cordatum TaxID=2364126 RepID=A0ABN9S0K1_9DINO|nr:unnamed protein product [Polarella glacialis]